MRKRKKVLIIGVSLLVVLTVGIILAYRNDWFYKASTQQKRFMREINAANSVVWYYGSCDPGKEITLNYKKVYEFNEDTIGDSENEYIYHFIIIYDFDGKMNISDEELLLIKEYCENNYYDMLYYGTEHLEQFAKCGFYNTIDPSEYGFTYNGSYWMNRVKNEDFINPYLLTGNWTQDDNERYDTENEHRMWKFAVSFMVTMIDDSK